MTDPRKQWDTQLEGDLPDCRLSHVVRHDNMITVGRMQFERVFCANCGCPGGGVTPEFAAHVFYVCSTCANILGPPPGCIEVQEETESRGVIA
jgi:hypothetical protein